MIRTIVVCDYDPAWPVIFEALRARVAAAMGDLALAVEHVGSTSVPGLAAKPIIDIDLLIDETTDESRYIPALERLGYQPDINLHVWPLDAPEPIHLWANLRGRRCRGSGGQQARPVSAGAVSRRDRWSRRQPTRERAELRFGAATRKELLCPMRL